MLPMIIDNYQDRKYNLYSNFRRIGRDYGR